MSFFTLPPEINSLRMFLGAGSAPMLQAAAAWDGLAAELGAAANSFQSVIGNLAGQAWQGAASAAMATAAAPYAGWLAAAASQSLGAAGQARSVVNAFEAARAATVQPTVVSANRNAFVQLVMSNLFGQNAPAIALAESIYEEMWAADVTAMAGYYSGAAAAAAEVVPWQSVLQSFPALAGGVAGAVGAMGGGAGAPSGAGDAGGANVVGGATPGTAGTAGAAASGGGGAGGVGGADTGLAPASYAGGDAGAYTGGTAAGTDVGSGAATTASTGVAGSHVGGFGMMPMPMPMGGLTRSAGLLGDGPSMPVPVKSEKEKDEEAAATPEAEETSEAQEAEAREAEVLAMSVLTSAASDIAVAAASGEAKQAGQATGASGIPASGFRASEAAAEEAEESVATLRPKIAPGEFHPRAEEEETAKVQIRGG